MEYLTKPPNFSLYGLNSHFQDCDDVGDAFTDRKIHQTPGIPPPPPTMNQRDNQSQSNPLNHTQRGPYSDSSNNGYSKGFNSTIDSSIAPPSSNLSNDSNRNDKNKKKVSTLARDADDVKPYPSINRSNDNNDMKGMERNLHSAVGHTSTLSGTKAVSIRPSFSRTIGSADIDRNGGEKKIMFT